MADRRGTLHPPADDRLRWRRLGWRASEGHTRIFMAVIFGCLVVLSVIALIAITKGSSDLSAGLLVKGTVVVFALGLAFAIARGSLRRKRSRVLQGLKSRGESSPDDLA